MLTFPWKEVAKKYVATEHLPAEDLQLILKRGRNLRGVRRLFVVFQCRNVHQRPRHTKEPGALPDP